jgi:transcription initiation factor IIE alpha subunit
MPISRENFVRKSFKKVSYGDVRDHPVAVFLRTRHRLAYTVKEIAKELKATEFSVRNAFRRLRKKRLVEYDSPYFIWKVDSKSSKKSRSRVAKSKKKSKRKQKTQSKKRR